MSGFEMLLILTNSYDATTDLLINRLPADEVFRFNCDLLNSYKIEANCRGFSIEDCLGRRVTDRQISKLYYRKPWIDTIDQDFDPEGSDRFRNEELRYLISEIISILWIQEKIVLVEPYAERRCGKIVQLTIARSYFSVPEWVFRYRVNGSNSKSQIVKSLSGEQVSKGKVLYTTQVDPQQLDPEYPWLIQEYVQAATDLTVVFCRGTLFAYALDRSFVDKSPDWREFISERQQWSKMQLPEVLCQSITEYMRHLKLHYGRLDFLITRDDVYAFCEVNPNGQYAWLDLEGKNGLLDCIISEISPASRTNPIPHSCPISSLER